MLAVEPIPCVRRSSSMEAVLLLEDGDSPVRPRIAGVSLADRALRILLRGGFAQVSVVADKPSRHWLQLERKKRIRLLTSWSPGSRAALVVRGDTAFERSFPAQLVSEPGDGASILYRRADGPVLALVVEPGMELAPAGPREFEQLAGRLQEQRAEIRNLPPDWVCQIIETAAEARQFHLRIEKNIIKSTDDMFARWNRRMSVPLSRVLAQLPITPNQVTFFTLFVALAGAYLLAAGSYWEMLAGAVLTQISSILDGNDGELARLKVQDSDFGTWLDTLCDYVSYFLTFGAIGWGLHNRHSDPYYLILVGLFFAGLGIAMPLLAYFRKNHTRKGEAGSFKGKAKKTLEIQEKRNIWSYLSARLHHFATRATFTYFLVLFGILDWWPLVLYCAVVGAHAFWIAVIYHARFLKEEWEGQDSQKT